MVTVDIETNHGNISFDLLPELAPETVRNFEKLARDGFYDGTLEKDISQLYYDLQHLLEETPKKK